MATAMDELAKVIHADVSRYFLKLQGGFGYVRCSIEVLYIGCRRFLAQ